MKYCKNAKLGVHTNDSYEEYGGYCFDCYCAGVPEMQAEIERGRKALDWLNGNYHWLVGSMTKEDQADLDAILGDWKP